MLPLWLNWEDLIFGACRHTSTFSGRRPHLCQAAKLLSCMSPEPLCTQHLALLSAKVAEPNTPCFPPSLRCAAAAHLFICTNFFCSTVSSIPFSGFAMPVTHCICSRLHNMQDLESSQSLSMVRPSFLLLLCLLHSRSQQSKDTRITVMPHFGSQHCGVIVNLTSALCAIAVVQLVLTS